MILIPLNNILNTFALNCFRDTGHVDVPCGGCVTVVLGSIVDVVISGKSKLKIKNHLKCTVQARYTL